MKVTLTVVCLFRYWDKALGTYKNPRDVAAFNKDV